LALVPQLSPFRGLRYDPRTVADAAAVLCPPYDVISPAQRARLAARDPRNAVHVELPQAEGDPSELEPYRVAARKFAGWQADGSLLRDARPLIYAYEQRYRLGGDDRLARGFFCLLRLEPFGTGVRAHERTMAGPKEDRFRLLQATRANLSPVLMLYESGVSRDRTSRLLDQLVQAPPAVEATDDDGVVHRLWPADPERSPPAAELLEHASAGPLTIADGHHRYETALRFRDEERARRGDAGAAENVLVLLYEAGIGGLSVLPTHRLVLGTPGKQAIIDAAQELLAVTPCDSLDELLAALAQPGRLGLWTSRGGALLEPLRERVAGLLPAVASDALRWLDVTVLTSLLPVLVGQPAQELLDGGRLAYVKDAEQAAATVAADDTAALFLLPPTPVETVLSVAAAGEQMPHKSTYFHPKAATGLVFNPLDE
jgi:uncharacterized protein (DUF1015 family)